MGFPREIMTTAGLALAGIAGLAAGCSGVEAPPSSDSSPSITSAAPIGKRPKLVAVITVDGLPTRQLIDHRELFSGGLRRLMDRGAWLTEARHGHGATFTACAFATLLTGADPAVHGIVGNDWWDRATGARTYCVEDTAAAMLGEPGPGRSPRLLGVETVGDVLRRIDESSRVVSISIKDRAAILPAGHSGQAYFYSAASGAFATSRYYRDSYPDWWRAFHGGKPQDRWAGESWKPLDASTPARSSVPAHRLDFFGYGRAFPHPLGDPAKPTSHYYQKLIRSPYGDLLTVDFALAAVRGESLGRNPTGATDLLAISLSTHDYIQHAFGPESPEALENLRWIDRTLGKLLEALEEWVGKEQLLLAFTSDHGFAVSPEHAREQGVDAGRVDPPALIYSLEQALSKRFGQRRYTSAWHVPTIYFDQAAIEAAELSMREVEGAARAHLLQMPGVAHVFTRTQLVEGKLPDTKLGRQVARAWRADRSGDLYVVQKPDWYMLRVPHSGAATHGSPYDYDTHVPLFFMGPGVRAGRYAGPAEIVDLAPTLSRLIGIPPPGGSGGLVLEQILAP